MSAERQETNGSLMDEVFAVFTRPKVGETVTVEEHHEKSHSAIHQVEYHSEHIELTSSVVPVGNVVGYSDESQRRSIVDTEDQRSEVSALSKATSVSVHSSVSQKSAQHYDLPPIPQYDMPPIVVGETITKKASSVASSKSGSRHSAASHHSHHSHQSALTHDSESTITDDTLVNQPIIVGGVVGADPLTPLIASQSLVAHEKNESIVSNIIPTSVHLESDSEDSIAPSKLTHSITVGGVVAANNGLPVLKKSIELEYTDFAAPAYYQAPPVQVAFDTKSEDSFGFEKVEYVEQVDRNYEQEESIQQVVHGHATAQQTYDPYELDHQSHNASLLDFEEERYSNTKHQHHDNHIHHHHHYDSHVTHNVPYEVKQSRSNSASTNQSGQIYAHIIGPKITEQLRPAAVVEEKEVEVKVPVMAYVAPIPIKPPRTHEESHHYNAYETDIVKSTTVIQEDVRSGSEGVSSLRKMFEHGAPPTLSPVLVLKKYDNQDHHHNHHEDIFVEQPKIQKRVSEHVQLGGSGKAYQHSDHQNHHHNHHENGNDVPSRTSSFHQQHSRTSSVSTVRGAPIQRVTPTVQPIQNIYGDHQSVRIVKNVREYVNDLKFNQLVPPKAPFAGIPRLPARSPISPDTFQQCQECDCHREKSVVSTGRGITIDNASRKNTTSSLKTSIESNAYSAKSPVYVSQHLAGSPTRSRNATLTQDNVQEHHYDPYDGETTELIKVSEARKLFETNGPAHLPEYASALSDYIH